jgi:hypothetical protein
VADDGVLFEVQRVAVRRPPAALAVAQPSALAPVGLFIALAHYCSPCQLNAEWMEPCERRAKWAYCWVEHPWAPVCLVACDCLCHPPRPVRSGIR